MSDPTKSIPSLTPETPEVAGPDTPALDDAEARMRRALGLGGDAPIRPRAPEPPPPRPAERFNGALHKRRFVQDGEVPVTIVHGRLGGDAGSGRTAAVAPVNRVEAAESARAAEVQARERAERALAEATTALHDAQTKLGHADLARQEAIAAVKREQEQAGVFRATIAQLREQLQHAESELHARNSTIEELRTQLDAKVKARQKKSAKTPASVSPASRGRSKQASATNAKPAKEPKPVRWWLPTPEKKRR